MARNFFDLSTLGMKIAFAVESEAGTKPTVFTNIPKPKSLPDVNPEVNTAQTTSLNETEYHTYMQLLKDVGGALDFGFGMSDGLIDLWNTDVYQAYKTARAAGKAMWFELWHPELSKGFFFTGEPAELGFSAAEVDSVWDGTARITPSKIYGWAEAIAPTDATENP